jgi:hypothetical protein
MSCTGTVVAANAADAQSASSAPMSFFMSFTVRNYGVIADG